jgi:hypothetical protein
MDWTIMKSTSPREKVSSPGARRKQLFPVAKRKSGKGWPSAPTRFSLIFGSFFNYRFQVTFAVIARLAPSAAPARRQADRAQLSFAPRVGPSAPTPRTPCRPWASFPAAKPAERPHNGHAAMPSAMPRHQERSYPRRAAAPRPPATRWRMPPGFVALPVPAAPAGTRCR